MIIRFVYLTLLLFAFLIIPKCSWAADFRTDYKVEYFLEHVNNNIDARAKFDITITNLQEDTYIKTFLLSFPKSFTLSNLRASDNHGGIEPKVEITDQTNIVSLTLNSRPELREKQNNITLEFKQSNLFKVNGNVWEVILPTIEGREGGEYNVILNLPPTEQRKVSISKPKPDLIRGNQIFWNNPSSKTIYAVFGDKQFYDVQLRYNLANPRYTPVYTDIALPPDTLYQKTYINSLKPAPAETFQDLDGNLMARYFLKPREDMVVTYDGNIEIGTKSRPEALNAVRASYLSQKNSLLSSSNYWKLSDLTKIGEVDDPREIHDFVVKTLRYDYSRVSENVERLGADYALKNPAKAVCTEFADLFVAIAREKGIVSREVEGYGFSSDEQLRPLSLRADVLHSWPEYYDEVRQLWIPIDPTWENTSGIDYFSSFDLNHVVFAIHGKKSDYPHPAGSYKTTDSKDITIAAASEIATEKTDLAVVSAESLTYLPGQKAYELEIMVKNLGNTYAWNIPIKVKANTAQIASLAPFEKKSVKVLLPSANNSLFFRDKIDVYLFGDKAYSTTVKTMPYIFRKNSLIAAAIAALAILFFVWKRSR